MKKKSAKLELKNPYIVGGITIVLIIAILFGTGILNMNLLPATVSTSVDGCPIPTPELSIEIDEVAGKVVGTVVTNPGEGEEILKYGVTLYTFSGTRSVHRTDVNFTGPSKVVTFDWDKKDGSNYYYYFDLLLSNSCGKGPDPGWLRSDIICSNVCANSNLYSQIFDAGTVGCKQGQLIEINSVRCGYVAPTPTPTASPTATIPPPSTGISDNLLYGAILVFGAIMFVIYITMRKPPKGKR